MRLAKVAFGWVLLASLAAAQAAPSAKQTLCTVAGQVVQEPGGTPLRKVMVLLAPTSGISLNGRDEQNPYASVTDADGRFRVEGVQPGDYRVTLERNGFVATNHRSRVYSSTLLSITSGQEITGLFFRMLPAGVVQGKIVDEDGDPVPSVSVTAFSPTTQMSGQTNDLGEYRIAGLSGGKYLVVAQAGQEPVTNKPDEPRVYAPTYYPGTIDRGQAARIEVHPGEEASATFNLVSTRTFVVRGSVSGVMARRPQSGTLSWADMVYLQSLDNRLGQQFQGAILPNGTFEVTGVLPGSYSARATTQSAGSRQTIRASQTVEVRSADIEGLQLSPELPSQIRGRFRMDTNNNQQPDWTQLNVQVDPDDHDGSNGPIVGKVAKDGSFNVEVPSGTYHLVVTTNSNGEAWRDFIVREVVLNGKDVGDSGFSFAGGMTSLEIVASAQGSTIEGNVVDEDGKPVPDTTVVCVPDAGRRKRHDIYQQVQTDRQGHFTMRGLNPGEYQVFTLDDPADDITDPDFVSAHNSLGQSVKLDSGERKGVVLKLAPESLP